MEQNSEMNQEIKKLNTRLFLARLFGYFILGLFIPAAFLIWRFDLFSKTTGGGIRFGTWGAILVIFITFFLCKLAKVAVHCIDSILIRQIINAARVVLLPLLAITLCLYSVGDFWEELLRFFIVLTICEPIAYVLNPIPEYLKEKAEQRKQEEENKRESRLIKILEFFWDKKKE